MPIYSKSSDGDTSVVNDRKLVNSTSSRHDKDSKYKTEIKKLKSYIKDLVKEKEYWEDKCKDLESNINDTQTRVKELVSMVESKLEDTEEQQSLITELQNELKRKDAKLSQVSDQVSEERFNELQQKINDQDAAINSLKTQNKDALKDMAQKHADELRELKYEYREKISDLKSDIRLKEGELQSIKRSANETAKYWKECYEEVTNTKRRHGTYPPKSP